MSLTRFQSRAEPRPAADVLAEGAPALHVVTFGCQMNKYDSLLVEGRFRKRGYRITGELDDADVVLFNTCSVRDHAEERAFSWVGELKRVKQERPDLVLGVMGCMAQRVEEEIFGRAGHVDIVCGTRSFQRLPELVAEVRERRADPERFRPRDLRVLDTDMAGEVAVDRTAEEYTGGLHGWLAVMRGCDLNCAFCIVPTTRGRVQSRPIEDLVREARWMVEQGARAITLLGQTVNSYGEDLPTGSGGTGRGGRPSLADLIDALQEIDGLARIRLVTLHPAYVTEALAESIARNDKVERFLPLPLQAGSDDVLRAMKRGYTTELYQKRIDLLRERVPDLELASDWIVGFPGESERDFAESERLLEQHAFAVNYIFKYDPRPGTRSADRSTGREDEVPEPEKKSRNQRLLAAAERAGRVRHASHVGATRRVFVEDESTRDEGILRGKTEHGLPVSFPGDPALIGTELDVTIESASPFGMSGARKD